MTFTPAKWKSLNNAGNKLISGRKQREIASSIAYVSGRFSCAPFFYFQGAAWEAPYHGIGHR